MHVKWLNQFCLEYQQCATYGEHAPHEENCIERFHNYWKIIHRSVEDISKFSFFSDTIKIGKIQLNCFKSEWYRMNCKIWFWTDAWLFANFALLLIETMLRLITWTVAYTSKMNTNEKMSRPETKINKYDRAKTW